MSEPLHSVGAITLFVDDVNRAGAFYRKVFDLRPVFEDDNSVAFRFENMIVNLLVSSAAHGLVSPGDVGNSADGSRFQLTIWVQDADAVCEVLAARGVELLNGPIDRPWGMRTASFTDPDGHVWEVAQELRAEAS